MQAKQVSLGILTKDMIKDQFKGEKFFIAKCTATTLNTEQLNDLFRKNHTEFKEFVRVEKRLFSKTVYTHFVFKNSVETAFEIMLHPFFEIAIIFLKKDEPLSDFDVSEFELLFSNQNVKKIIHNYGSDDEFFLIARG